MICKSKILFVLNSNSTFCLIIHECKTCNTHPLIPNQSSSLFIKGRLDTYSWKQNNEYCINYIAQSHITTMEDPTIFFLKQIEKSAHDVNDKKVIFKK